MKHRLPTSLFLTAFALVFAASSTGCLKTRAGLRNDMPPSARETEPGGGVPVKVTDVEAQNQRVVEEMKAEIARLTGRLDELERANQDLTQAASRKEATKSEETKRLEARIQELEASQVQMIEALKKKEREAPPKVDPIGHFEEGKKLHAAKKHQDAIEQFTEYLKFPKGRHREEALFLRAESYYTLTQYKKAIIDYSDIHENFPKSKRMPQVLMRIGLSFEAMGMKSDAKVFFQQLVDKYPKSAEAKKALPKTKAK